MDSANRWTVVLLVACGLGLLGLVVVPYQQQERQESLPSPSTGKASIGAGHAQSPAAAVPQPAQTPAPTPVPRPEGIGEQAGVLLAPAPHPAGTVDAPSEASGAPSVVWTRAKCMEVDQALQIDSTRALRLQFDNLGRGVVRAADGRNINSMRDCTDGAMTAATAADFGDDDVATKIMLDVYRVWNEVRASLDLQPVAYGSLPDATVLVRSRPAEK